MRARHTLIHTLREAPADASVASHALMLRAGLVNRVGSGLYSLLPLGLRTFRKIENVVREEMNRSGALEVQLPVLTPADLWERSGRFAKMGREMFRLKDRHDVWTVLGPTHEEAITELTGQLIRSYRDLPVNVYQIHTKFRDEIRPRFGAIRCREFVMKDAYSFHVNDASLDETYQAMRQTYRRIFQRLGLHTVPVEADTGAMGGSGSEEFMVPSEIGEETLLISEGDQYKSNQEKTPVIYSDEVQPAGEATQELDQLDMVATPGCKTIEQVAAFLKIAAADICKAVAYRADGSIVIVCIRGDRQANEIKLRNHLGASELLPATESEVDSIGSVAGYIGPLGLSGEPRILFDCSLKTRADFIIGANKVDTHARGFVCDPAADYIDLALAEEGDPSPAEDGRLKAVKGIEVGHIFKLGDKYTRDFGVSVLNENGKAIVPTMGCYGIGVNRTMATIIEQWHDDKGIRWPISAAPFEFAFIAITKGDEEQSEAEAFYSAMIAAGMEVFFDDRDLRPGVRFNDAELIGFPIRITMGKGYFQSGELELYLRTRDVKRTISGDHVRLIAQLKALRTELFAELEGAEFVEAKA